MAATQDEDIPADPESRGKGWRWLRTRFTDTDQQYYAQLGERVEKILRLAEAEAEEIREAARKEATTIIEAAEGDAARIRAEAIAAIRDGAREQP